MQANATVMPQRRGLDYKWIVAMVTIIGVFMSILDSTIVNIAIPRLQTAFGADLHSVQWVLTVYILTQGVIVPTTAFFTDRFGIKRFYIVSLAAFTLGSALCGIAWSLPVLIFFRVLQGLGGAALFPLSITLLFREFPPEQRGTAMGIFGIPALLAPALGPTLGGYIVTFASWQFIFYINVPIGIAAVILATIFLHESRGEAGVTFDIPGFIFSALGLATILYGFSDASTDGWNSGIVLGCLAVGMLSLVIFTIIELIIANRGGQPLLDLRVFGNWLYTFSTISFIIVTFALFGGLFLIPVYLQSLRGLSAYQAGLILLPQALASMVSVVLGGRLVDKIGVRAVVIPGLVILAFALWQLSSLTLYWPYGYFQIMLILRGFALGLIAQPLIVSALAEIRPRLLAQASSVNAVVRAVASSFGIALLATLVQTQTQMHYAHLAEQVTAASPLGQLIPELQALIVSQGGTMQNAYATAIQLINGFVEQQSYMLAIQDAFLVTAVVALIAIIPTLFVRKRRTIKPSPETITDDGIPAESEIGAEGEAALAAI